jgi:putative NADH-flavin reductase
MKKIIVFGATGGSGKETVQQAIEKGYQVTAVVRNTAALDLIHPDLKIIKGDVLQPATFEKEIIGKEAVISCLGAGNSIKPTTVYSAGISNIMTAMKEAAVKRLICISAVALYTNKEMGFFIRAISKVLLHNILKNPYADMRLMENIVEAGNIDWTIVRPPALTNKPMKGKYRIAVQSHLRHPWNIARADLAHFMLGNIENTETFKAIVEIAY